ncbi:MAG: right-handed parallel beta-helix repeat-containing protein [Alphaproteobacteria bacterium]|nr:right-handed parallel beta-helix repeat-containing protein [Alphaproteobacteria bacterium]
MNRRAIIWLPLIGLLAAACKGGDPLPPSLSITETALDFGTVPISSEAQLSLTLSNGGDGEVEVLSVQLIEGDSGVFDIDRDGSLLLAEDLVLDVTVTFTPRDEDRYLGQIQIRFDDGETSSVLVDLVGQGSASEADDDGDGYRVSDGDCDDGNPDVHPGAAEICDGRDNDCSGSAGSDEADSDGDGYRLCDGDCDDGDRNVHPGATEICDNKDTDCDGSEHDNDDLDGDGYSLCTNDCDDDDALANPGRAEVCDGRDSDCSGVIDDIDQDGDGHSVCSGAGDCDDTNPSAYPVVVDPNHTGEQHGTDQFPYTDLDTALSNLDNTCRTAWLAAGSYTVSRSLSGVELSIIGEGAEAVTLSPPESSRIFELSDGASLTLADVTLSGSNVGGDGGAIRAVDAELLLDGVIFSGNTCSGDGGALSASSSLVVATDCVFENNTAVDDGGAVALLSAEMVDAGSSYSGNQGVRGGAIVSDSSTLELTDGWFRSNTATDKGGAVAVIGGSDLVIERNEMALNTASSAGGAMSFVDVNDSDSVVRNNLIQDNNGGASGGGVSIGGTRAGFLFVNNTLYANTATATGAGLAVTAADASGLELLSNLVTWSAGPDGLYVATGAGADVGWNTAFATSSGTDFGGEASAGVNDNERRNPGFVTQNDNRNPDDDDLRLGSGSAEINSGPPDSRFNDQDGSQNDRGYTGGPAAP